MNNTMKNLKDEIEEKIKEWKDEVGEIPEATCPNIDKLIKGLTDLEDIINRADRNYDDVSTLAGDLSWTMPDYSILEDLRKDNDQLRALGGFWYERCRELTTLLQQERENAVDYERGFRDGSKSTDQPKTTSTDIEEKELVSLNIKIATKDLIKRVDAIIPEMDLHSKIGLRGKIIRLIAEELAPHLSNKSELKKEAVRKGEK